MQTERNAYLANEYAPVRDEEILDTWTDLEFVGELPAEIRGYFLRNSANPRFKPIGKHHWFDGDGFIHGIRFSGGKAQYLGRYVETKKFVVEQRARKSRFVGLKEQVRLQNGLNLMAYLLFGKNPFKDTSNTTLTWHDGRLLSTWSFCGSAYEVDVEQIATKGIFRFDDPVHGKARLKGAIAAHPKICPINGDMIFMDFARSWKPRDHKMTVTIVSRDSQSFQTREIPLHAAKLMHDIAITPQYIVIMDLPAEVGMGMKYNFSTPTRFGILRRDGQPMRDANGQEVDVLWFHDPSSCFIMHTVNAFEDGDNIVLTGVRRDEFILGKIYPQQKGEVNQGYAAYYHKWIFDLKTGAISGEGRGEPVTEVPEAIEFPTVNPNYVGLRNRYSYLPLIATTKTYNYSGFIKHDAQLQSAETYDFGPGVFGSEMQFVPREGGSDEDDGWLLTYTFNRDPELQHSQRSRLLIFDAKRIGAGPIAQAVMPRPVPISFHGTWVPN